MSIHLNKPYKIIELRHKRYNAHYDIPSSEVVVIPLRNLGSEVMCDIRWENGNGILEVRHKAMFKSDNLIPLNSMIDDKLFELWTHYYGEGTEEVSATTKDDEYHEL